MRSEAAKPESKPKPRMEVAAVPWLFWTGPAARPIVIGSEWAPTHPQSTNVA